MDKKSHLTQEELKKFLMEEGTNLSQSTYLYCDLDPSTPSLPHPHTGEPFTQEEMDEMLTAAVDPDKGVVLYRDFIATMVDDQS